MDGHAELVGHRLDERRGAEFHAADQQGRGQLLLPDRYAVAVDHHVEVPWQRHQRCAGEAGIQAEHHDGVGQGDAGGPVTVAGRIVGVQADSAVGSDQQEVAGWKGLVGPVINIVGGPVGAVGIVGGGRWVGLVDVGQHAGGDLYADDAGDSVLEGCEAGGSCQYSDREHHTEEDDQPLGPRPP